MAWIDNKKALDIFLQSCIIDCLKMYKVSGKVIKFIEETMKNLKVELNISCGVNPETNLPGRCAITITICNIDDTT